MGDSMRFVPARLSFVTLLFALGLGCSGSTPAPSAPIAEVSELPVVDSARSAPSDVADSPVEVSNTPGNPNGARGVATEQNSISDEPVDATSKTVIPTNQPNEPAQQPGSEKKEPVIDAGEVSAKLDPKVGDVELEEPPYELALEARDTYCQAKLDHDWVTVFNSYLPGYDQQTVVEFEFIWTADIPRDRSAKEKEDFFRERNEILKKYDAEGYDSNNPATFDKVRNIQARQACYIDLMEFQTKFNVLREPVQWENLKQAKMIVRNKVATFASAYVHSRSYKLMPLGLAFVFDKGKWGVSITTSYEEEVRTRDILVAREDIQRSIERLVSPVANLQMRSKFQAGNKKITSLGISPDGAKLTVGMADKEIFSWLVNHAREMLQTRMPDWEKYDIKQTAIAWSPDAQTIAVAANERIYYFESDGRSRDKNLPLPQPSQHLIQELVWVGDEHLLAGSGEGAAGQYEIIAIRTGKRIFTKAAGSSQSVRAAVAPDLTLLAFGVNNTLELYELAHDQTIGKSIGRPLVLDAKKGGKIGAIAISRDCHYLAASYDSKIKQWQRDGDEFVKQFENGMPGTADFLAYTADNKRLIASGTSIQIIDASSGKTLATDTHPGGKAALAIDAKTLLTEGKSPGEVYVWDLIPENQRPGEHAFLPHDPDYPPKNAPPDPDLQGTWYCLSATNNEAIEYHKQGAQMIVAGNNMKIIPTQGKPSEYTLATKPSASPKTLNLEWDHGIGLNRRLGIYKVDGDRLEMCLRPYMGPDAPESRQGRPKDFRTDLIFWILTRKPLPAQPAIEVKKIAPKFSTPQEAFETYRLAMIHHDWATAYQSYLPASQIPALVAEIEWTRAGSPDHTHEIIMEYFRQRKAILKKYNVEQFDSTNPMIMEKVRALVDPQGFYVEVMELQAKHNILKEPNQWEQMKGAKMKLADGEATFYYQFQRVFDKKPLPRVIVFGNQNGQWGIDDEKTFHAAANIPIDEFESSAEPASEDEAANPEFRTWTSANGKFKIEAKLRSVINKVAQLEKADGSISKVPVEKLSTTDQQYIANKSKK